MFDDEWFEWAEDQFFDGIIGLVPPVPEAVKSACARIADSANEFGILGHFVPWWALVGIAIILSVIVAVIAIRLVRIALSLASGGGGA